VFGGLKGKIMKILRISLLLVALTGVCAFAAEKTDEKPAAAPLVEEGSFMDGVEGLLQKDTETNLWYFTPDKPVEITEKVTVAAGTKLELLPCSVLQQMAGLAGKDNKLPIKLSALFTLHNHTNYLFSVFFLPIKDSSKPAPETEEKEPETADPQTDDPDSIIPTNILKKIKETKTPDLETFQNIAQVTGDVNLIGRAGYLSKKDGTYIFEPDAFGQNVDDTQFILLGNSALTAAQKEMAREPGRERYNVSGLVTTYNGKTYMLLRRASRTYTHGNFTP